MIKICYSKSILYTLFNIFIGLLCVTVLLFTKSHIALGIAAFILIFYPGYLFLKLLWPSNNISNTLFISFIFPTSIAIIGVLLLVVNYFGVYRYERVVILQGIVIIGLAILTDFRSPIETRGSIAEKIQRATNRLNTFRWKIQHTLLALSTLFLIASILYAAITPRHQIYLTEFYVMTSDKRLPITVSIDDLIDNGLILGITNRESRDMDYSVVISATTDNGDAVLDSFPISVAKDTNIEQILRLRNLPEGVSEINLSLYTSEKQEVYRSLRLWLDVAPAP